MRLIHLILFLFLFSSCNSAQKKKAVPLANKVEVGSPLVLDTFRAIPILFYETNPENIQFFLKNEKGRYFNNHGQLKKHIEKKGKTLRFAMNGGMYLQDDSPQGLYIENGKELKKLNTKQSSYGNFYMKPNGVFYIDVQNKGHITTTKNYSSKQNVKFATQSGPMLLIQGKLHSKFVKNSNYVHIRNGVGILPNGALLFAMSYQPITFYDFASYFKSKGCENALYLDGAISKTYLPEKGVEQVTGKFGVIIAETIE